VQFGEGLIGQCAWTGVSGWSRIPEHGGPINSAGASEPKNIVVLPVLFGTSSGRYRALLHQSFTTAQMTFLDRLNRQHRYRVQQYRGDDADRRLLKQSQQLPSELQTQQKELRRPMNSLSKRRNSSPNATSK